LGSTLLAESAWPHIPGSTVEAVDGEGTRIAQALNDSVQQCMGEAGLLSQRLPGFRHRPGQLELAASIAESLSRRDCLVAEAGTGTGKTYAYLVPLLLSGARALISTGTRHLQDQLHARDLPAVKAALGVDVRTALLKGRSNYVCAHHLERALVDGRFTDPSTPGKLRRIHRFAQVSESGDRSECVDVAEDDSAWAHATSTRENCLGQECAHIKQCFVMRARREALVADVVVVNHHLFCADLALRDDGTAELLPNVEAIVFDEAHQLPDAASEFFGESVSTRQLIDLSRDLVRAGLTEARDAADWRSVSDRLERASRDLRLAFDVGGAQPGSRRLNTDSLRAMSGMDDAIDAVSADLVSVSAIVAANEGRGAELDRCGLRATELLERLQRWMGALGALDGRAPVFEGDEGHAGPNADPSVVWAETHGQHVSLRRTPLSVAAAFGRHRAGASRAWVFLSATLSMGQDFTHFVDALGLQDARCQRWESPFDFARQAACWIPRGIGAATSAGFSQRLASETWALIVANRGRAFVLCTSLRSMRDLAAAFRALDDRQGLGLTWLVQGESPRPILLERFRAAGDAVLVGSAGFWEGVDVSGDALSLVIIDKLPFAPPDDPVVQARGEAMRRDGKDPFTHSQLPEAALALKQGAGRLIRSETDRGVLVLGDERLLTRGYGKRLLASLPPFARVERCEDALQYLPGHTKTN